MRPGGHADGDVCHRIPLTSVSSLPTRYLAVGAQLQSELAHIAGAVYVITRTTCHVGNAGYVTCEACEPGSFSGVGSLLCRLCPAGKAADYAGATMCEYCPVGTASNSPGATTCDECPAGTASGFLGAIRCDKCCRKCEQRHCCKCVYCVPGRLCQQQTRCHRVRRVPRRNVSNADHPACTRPCLL